MQAVVLAGGMGTRLRPLTLRMPKPLLPVMGRPLMDHLLERLPKAVDEVLLTVSYLPGPLRAWAEATQDRHAGRSIQVIEETEPLGTGGAVANCAEHLDDTFLVLNGDLLSDVDLDAQIARHRERGGLGTLALHHVEDPSRFGVVALAAHARITRFVEKPPRDEAPSHLVNAGAYVLEREVLEHIPRGRAVSIEREVFPRLSATERGLYGHIFEGLWIDCGTPESYLEVHRRLLVRSGMDSHFGTGTRPEPPFEVERAVFGEGVHIGPGLTAADAVVHDGAHLAGRVRLVRTIVGAGARIGDGAQLTDCVVAPGAAVPDLAVCSGDRIGASGDDRL